MYRIYSSDGHEIGNGRIYAVGGLGQTLTLSDKTFINDEYVSLAKLSWITGSHYAVGNLGHG